MKLSWKFFCIAYVGILLSTGLLGAFVIQNAVDKIWEAQVSRVSVSENYAVDSFLSFANLSSEKITEKQNKEITRQIENILDSCISQVEIMEVDGNEQDYVPLEYNQGFTRFLKENEKIVMESACKVKAGEDEYIVSVKSDFSEIQSYRQELWQGYIFAIFFVAIISGILLYVIAGNVTKPLNRLTIAANEIAAGDYGKRVEVTTGDMEIYQLAKSFNSMSLAMEKSLQEIKGEVEKREAFVANFTHEMKTPMTAIIGYADMLKSYSLEPEEQRQASEAIYKEAKRLEQLSMQMLELMVIKQEQVTMKPVNLMELKVNLERTLHFLAEKYQISFVVDFPQGYAKGNSTLLLSLFYNLADNAFKASESGGVVMICGFLMEHKVKFFIKDNGRGIREEHMEHLTEPFYREDKARSRAQGGAGLGLALCKEIAERHSTELVFESEVGKGTKVSFELLLAGDKDE